MTMQDHMHPDDERLAAFSGADPEATGDVALSAHLDDCARCRDLVGELRMMRTALADLPDLVPSRPLRLLPPVPEQQPGFAGRAAGFIRRAFAPALTAGAALALVGMVGTAGTVFQGIGVSPAATDTEAARSAESDGAEGGGFGAGAVDAASSPETYTPAKGGDNGVRGLSPQPSGAAAPTSGIASESEDDLRDEAAEFSTGSDSDGGSSPWPIVLVAGIGIVAVVLVLRFTLVPRWG